MKRHIAWLVACGVLAGCASEPLPIDAPASPTPSQNTTEPTSHGADSPDSAEAHAAFYFESSTLEIGDFDPYTLGDDIFDPCTEISPEEFAAAGFHNVEPIPEEYAGLNPDINACFFETGMQHYALSIAATNASREIVEESRLVDSAIRSESLPSLFVYGTGLNNDVDCYAQIDTHRGGLSISVTRPPGLGSFEDSCNVAVSAFESLSNSTA